MIETANKKLKYDFLYKHEIKCIGIKLNKNMINLLAERIKQAQNGERGVNILIYGNLCLGVAEIESKQGKEFSFSFFELDNNIKIADWSPEKAYNGRSLFWFEGFKNKGDL